MGQPCAFRCKDLAGAKGLEPPASVLETAALPTELRPCASAQDCSRGFLARLAFVACSQRRALGALFLLLALAFAGVAFAAASAPGASAGGSSPSPPSRSPSGSAVDGRSRPPEEKPRRTAYSLRVAAGDTQSLARVPRNRGQGAPRPADPDVRAAREVRRRAGSAAGCPRTWTRATSSRTGCSG